MEDDCNVGHANAMSRPILRHILVRREAAGLEDGRAGMAQAFGVGLSCDISWFAEKRQDWKRVVRLLIEESFSLNELSAKVPSL